MKKLINYLMKIDVWFIFVFSVAGAMLLSIFLGLLINHFFYDGTNNLLMVGAVFIPAIDAPIFIILLIISIKELKISREKLDQRVSELRTSFSMEWPISNHMWDILTGLPERLIQSMHY